MTAAYAAAVCWLAAAAVNVAAAAAAAPPPAQFTVQRLMVEHLQQPAEHNTLGAEHDTLLGIDVERPRLSWRLAPAVPAHGVAQSAYRLVVRSGKKLVWDSAKQSSNRTTFVECCGSAVLTSDTRYDWTVTSWDANGAAAPSASASFHTGLFRASDWENATWITPGLERNLVRSPALHIPSAVASGTVFVAGVGYFELTVNGQRVGAGRKMDVAWTEYAKRVNYVSFNITKYLVTGENIIGVELGNSWYQDQGWYRLPPYYGCSSAASAGRHGQGSGTCNGGGFAYENPNQLLLSARVKLQSGGAPLQANSGGGWTAGAGPVTFNSLYDGEHYDARLEQPGWDRPGFTPNSGWVPADLVAPADNVMQNATLSSQKMEPIRVVEEETPHTSWLWNGSYIYDFGRNMVGVIRLKITQPVKGQTVVLKHAEVVMHEHYGPADGRLYYGSLRNAKATDQYTMKGGAEAEVFEPKFTSHGFRYLEISGLGYAPQDGDITRLVLHNDVSSRSSLMFNADGADVLNKITHGSRNSILGNLLGGPGSCGGRDERQFFTGDTNFAGEASLLHYDVSAIYSNWVSLAADTQLPAGKGAIAGSIGDYAPLTVGREDGGHTNWASGAVNVAYLLWKLHGDERVISSHMQHLDDYVAFNDRVYNHSNGGLKGFKGGCIAGWITIGRTPNCPTMTGFAYVNDLRMMAEMTAAIDAPSAQRYARAFKERLEEYHAAFYAPGSSTYGHGTQSEQAMALWLNAPPTVAIRTAVAANLAAQIDGMIDATVNATSSTAIPKCTSNETTGCLDFVGGVGLVYLFEALAQNGHGVTALRLALKTSYPSYGYMFSCKNEPSTTLWELWDSDVGSPTMDSRNHIYSASVSTFFFKYLGGIQAIAPGYSKALIAPMVVKGSGPGGGALHTVECTVGTPHGSIASQWTTKLQQQKPDRCSGGPRTTCDVVEEGDCATCGKVCLGCNHGHTIEKILFADFGSASPDVRPSLSNCSSGLHVAPCAGGATRSKCHACTNCPKCDGDRWPNATAVVEKMCLGKESCTIPVDFDIFGDTCPGKKVLTVKVQCSGTGGRAGAEQQLLYRHVVAVPVGVEADVVVPLLGHAIGNVTITEGGHVVWSSGKYAPSAPGFAGGAADTALGGVRFAVGQGGFVFELLA
jgi:alpha-L-rhamnosidase